MKLRLQSSPRLKRSVVSWDEIIVQIGIWYKLICTRIFFSLSCNRIIFSMLCSTVSMILLYFIIVIVHGQFSSLINPSYFQKEAFKLTSSLYLFSSSQSLWWNAISLSLATQVSLLNLQGRDNLCLMKCFNFQLGKFCSINIKC